jgi:flagellar biosynthesis/type III secretory pathway protein FliH
MTKKAKIQLNRVFSDVEDIEVVRELRALTVALQKEITALELDKERLRDELADAESEAEELRDMIKDRENDLDEREATGHSRGYDDGYLDGKAEGYETGYNEGRDYEADQNRPGA